MKTFTVMTLGLILGLSAAPRADAAGQIGRVNERGRGDQVCVYKDINYMGAEHCYSAGDEITNMGSEGRSISSIRLYGRSSVTVFENTNFHGQSVEFTASVPDLGRRIVSGNNTWSDRIESLRVASNGQVNNGNSRDVIEMQPNRQQTPRDGICVYSQANYQGRSECYSEGQNISNLYNQGNGNDQISSIRVYGRSGVTVYQDSDYRGQSMIVDHSLPNLSSMRGKSAGNGNGNGRGRGRGNRDQGFNWDQGISSMQIQRRNNR